ncbi:MAG: TIGR04283 family arsenosugar biosynthesis glycosyltransferase [Paracoccaceae bacterium]
MRAPISVIIPTLNAGEALPGCAAALMEGVEAGLICELIVSDGGSQDGTIRVAEDIGAKVLSGSASRGGQLRRGCDPARGTWLLVVHADTQLAPGWSAAAYAHMATKTAGWGELRFDQGGVWVARWANWRSHWVGLPYGDQALLIPNTLYKAVGGYPDQPLMEDVALARALKGQLRPARFTAVTSSAKYRNQGWVRRGFKNLTLLLRYLLGADPKVLAQAYRASPDV